MTWARAGRWVGPWVLVGVVAGGAAAQTAWTEAGDARSYPDLVAQQTRGSAPLETISGSTGGVDLRDAYCIRITDPASFLATNDPATAAGASGDFDTRLFLFDRYGAGVLANDDTPAGRGSGTGLATLRGAATDGSGFVLSRPDDFVLVVAGSGDAPLDPDGAGLFDLASDVDAVHAPDTDSGRFAAWEGAPASTGSYTLVLDGAEPCQEALDLFGGGRACPGSDDGSFGGCAEVTPFIGPDGVDVAFLNDDAHPDMLVGGISVGMSCLGSESGPAPCVNAPLNSSFWGDVEAADFDGDGLLDAVFGGSSSPSVCIGDGLGGFSSCGLLGIGGANEVELGFVDDDAEIDLVLAGPSLKICLGDGEGAFDCSDLIGGGITDAAVGDVDGDGNLDIVATRLGATNLVCLGDGEGAFACGDANSETNNTRVVLLGLLNGDALLDAVFLNDSQRHRVCRGDGLGGFTLCTDVSDDQRQVTGADLGFIDADDELDLVVASFDVPSLMCLGTAIGTFSSCVTDLPVLSTVELAELGPIHLFADGFESQDACAWTASVPTAVCPE